MIIFNIKNPFGVAFQIVQCDTGMRILPDITNRFVEELKGKSKVGLIYVVYLGDDCRVRDAVSRTGYNDGWNPVLHDGLDLIRKLNCVHHSSSGGTSLWPAPGPGV